MSDNELDKIALCEYDLEPLVSLIASVYEL